jgi:Uncharacterized protein conserved in bacteria (DUF2325)
LHPVFALTAQRNQPNHLHPEDFPMSGQQASTPRDPASVPLRHNLSVAITPLNSARDPERAEAIREVVDAFRNLRASVARFVLMLEDIRGNARSLEATTGQSLGDLLSRETAEQRALDEQRYAQTLSQRLDDTIAMLNVVQAECNALEQALVASGDEAGSNGGSKVPDLTNLSGKRVVYVGGRPGSNAALRHLVESAGGDFVVHDGGIEDRKGMFAAALPRADIVVFPVDCIDHDSMNLLKRVCERHQVDYHPLRTASVASFVELMTRLGRASSQSGNTPPASWFCLRHG